MPLPHPLMHIFNLKVSAQPTRVNALFARSTCTNVMSTLQVQLAWQHECQASGSKRSLPISALEVLAEVSHTHEPRSVNGEVASSASWAVRSPSRGTLYTLWSRTCSFVLDEQLCVSQQKKNQKACVLCHEFKQPWQPWQPWPLKTNSYTVEGILAN